MRRTFVQAMAGVVGAAVLAAAGTLTVEAAPKTLDVRYRLEFGAEKDFVAPRAIKSGETFKVGVRAASAANVYLLVSKAEDEYSLVLPRKASSRVRANQWVALPGEGEAFRVDRQTGVERMYLIVSDAPVDELEDLVAEGKPPDTLTESWILKIRDQYAGDGDLRRRRQAGAIALTFTAPAEPAVIVEQIVLRHDR